MAVRKLKIKNWKLQIPQMDADERRFFTGGSRGRGGWKKNRNRKSQIGNFKFQMRKTVLTTDGHGWTRI